MITNTLIILVNHVENSIIKWFYVIQTRIHYTQVLLFIYTTTIKHISDKKQRRLQKNLRSCVLRNKWNTNTPTNFWI